MDSLRYWVTEMHVDGFRFDLAATLARQFHEVDRLSAFFDLVQQDPVVSQVKLIAEPWDVGEGGYQVGNFPPLWTEWNGKYRDTVRDFWRGEHATLPEFASRLHRLLRPVPDDGRRPSPRSTSSPATTASRCATWSPTTTSTTRPTARTTGTATSDNRSWNCGAEGPTDDPAILALRARQQRNFLATLLLSQGVPMLPHGDEMGRTQQRQQQRLLPGQRDLLGALAGSPQGHSRACSAQAAADGSLLDFTRAADPAAPRPPGVPPPPLLPGPAGPRRRRRAGRHRLVHPGGEEMTERGLGRRRSPSRSSSSSTATRSPSRTPAASPIRDDSFLLLFNASPSRPGVRRARRPGTARVGDGARHRQPGRAARAPGPRPAGPVRTLAAGPDRRARWVSSVRP